MGCCKKHGPRADRRVPDPAKTNFLGHLVLEWKWDEELQEHHGRRFTHRGDSIERIQKILQGLTTAVVEFPLPSETGGYDFSHLRPHGLEVEAILSEPVIETGWCRCRKSRHNARAEGVSETLFLFVAVSEENLVSFAKDQAHRMLLHAKAMQYADAEENHFLLQDDEEKHRFSYERADSTNNKKLKPIPDAQLAIPGYYAYDYVTCAAKYYNCHPASKGGTSELFYVYGHTCSVLSASDALKITVRAITATGFDLRREVKSSRSPLVTWFPDNPEYLLSDEDKARGKWNLRQPIKDKWLAWYSMPWQQPLDKLRYYFGEKITIYFAFLAHTTFWLLFPAVFGIIVSLRRYLDSGVSNTENGYSSVFGLFTAVWVTFYLEHWKRVQSSKAQEWGMQRFEKEEQPRPEYLRHSKTGRSRVTGEVQAEEHPIKYAVRKLLSYSIITTMVVMVLIAVFSMFVLRVWLVKKEPDDINEGWGDRSTALINALQIQVMSYVYRFVARKLTDFENHRTQTMYNDNLIIKTCLFQFVNNYFSLMYIAFLKNEVTILGSKQQCDNNDCLSELETQVATILLVRVVLGNVNELLLPKVKDLVKRLLALCCCKATESVDSVPEGERHTPRMKRLKGAEKEAKLLPYDPFEDYLELLLMFGYAALFGVAFPLAPLIVLANTFLELKLDALKLFLTYQRPPPSGAQDIGTWYVFFMGLGYVAVLTNLGVAIFTNSSDFFGISSTRDKLIAFAVLEHFLLLLKFVLGNFIRDVPTEVTDRNIRAKYLRDKLLDSGSDRVHRLKHGNRRRRRASGYGPPEVASPPGVSVEMAPLRAGATATAAADLTPIVNPMMESKQDV